MKATRRAVLAFSFGAFVAPALVKPSAAGESVIRDDLRRHFEKYGVNGTFVLLEVDDERMTLVNPRRAEERFVPASTFKIPNSVIALDTGVVRDENEIIPYGGKPQIVKAWEKDMSMREALPVSNVPVYQELARPHDRGDLDFKQYSQELRIASPQGRFVDYVAGLYWFKGVDEETYRRNVTRCSGSTLPAIAPGATPCEEGSATFVEDFGRADYGTRNINYAVFGEATFNFTDSFRALAGIRWTHDDLEYDHARVSSASATNSVPGIRAPYASEGSTSEDGYSGRAGLQYDFTDDVTAYVTYSRGYKGPAYNVYFNMQAIDTPVLAPEESDSYEIGLKSRLFGNRATANLALFDTTYDNYQANYFDLVGTTVVTRLINAGEVRTRGVELDFNARPIPELTLSGGVAYTHARIKNFNCPPGAAASCAVNGKPLPYSPDWKANVSALYVVPLTALVNWDLEIGTDFNWQSETQYDIAQSPDAIQGAYGIWNASIALTQPQQGWRASLVVKNITDKSYASFLGTGGQFINRVVPRDDQRYFGISLRKDF